MDWQLIFNTIGGSFLWYLVIKRLYGDRIAELVRRYPLIRSVPEWTEADEYYHAKFLEHISNCVFCDPQDNPCEIGDRILNEWKAVKEQE